MPRIALDDKLILIHDAEPIHRILEFPRLRSGRGVVLCNGRLLMITEEAWDKLREADDALRERRGLEPIESDTADSEPGAIG